MVPAKERGAWLREWKAELWHVAERQRAHTTAAFVAGAFRDAAILRDDLQPARKRDWQGIVSSPVHFLALLFAAMSVSVGLAFLFPGVRPLLLPAPYRDAHTLVIVSRDGASHSANPSISLGEFRYWQSAAQAVFSDLSFYDVVHKELHLGLGRGVALSVIRASGNLPALLQSPDFPDAGSMNALPKLVLSDAVWRRYFHADPRVIGRTVFLAGETVRIVGIAKASAWHLPGKPDVWLLESDRRMAALSERTTGFVIAPHAAVAGAPFAGNRLAHDGSVWRRTRRRIYLHARLPLYARAVCAFDVYDANGSASASGDDIASAG